MKTETKKYAELFIAMSTDFLTGGITEDHFINTMDIAVNQLKEANEIYNNREI